MHQNESMATHPPSHVFAKLPWWISRWLGYRKSPPPKLPDWEIWLWSFVGSFGALGILQGIFSHDSFFHHRGVPTIIASYGASAVLVFGGIEGPLSQPRQLMGGHFLGALTGLCVSKLFQQLPTDHSFHQLQWLNGAISTALAIVVMQATGTFHPPAGASALLAAVNKDVIWLSWYYLPVILLSSTMFLAVACFVNNIRRRYPVYWLYPGPPMGAHSKPAAAAAPPPPVVTEKARRVPVPRISPPPSSPTTTSSQSSVTVGTSRVNSRDSATGQTRKQI